MSYESFLFLSSNIRNLKQLQKRFVILENNLQQYYVNPTNIHIPDFTSDEYQNTPTNNLYDVFCANCFHQNGKEWIEYLPVYLDDHEEIHTEVWIDPMPIEWNTCTEAFYSQHMEDTCKLANEEQLESLLHHIREEGKITYKNYVLDTDGLNKDHAKLAVLNGIAHLYDTDIKFYTMENESAPQVRTALNSLLNEIWGYDSFLNLKIYRNPDLNRETIEISQGEIVETVVSQVENGANGSQSVKDILLTAPTGAGKSLLFQLSAIYLAQQYRLLTIVISPLVALMEDQVQHLAPYYPGVACLNSNKTPSEKEEILNKVRNGDIDILYLAPELLLSYHIYSFIGNRELGLVVVDEAHTVTTWGRDFRVDYWFLGEHLNQIRRMLRKEGRRTFAIFALTATAVYDPSRSYNDMVFETIDSLKMKSCIKYIGSVRRTNIEIKIRRPQIEGNYLRFRKILTVRYILYAIQNRVKTVVYFPFKSTINSLLEDINLQPFRNCISIYYSELNGADKQENARRFRDNETMVMCATKAYGMGVDVSDIEAVYHHAPTGSLCDYIQEIGRAARRQDLMGKAEIDFTVRDFYFINMLHGLSAIRTSQLRLVIKKLMELYDLNQRSKMIISSEDFAFIFPSANQNPNNARSEQDTKLKSCLMLISAELRRLFGYEAFYVRPKSMFTKVYLSVLPDESESFRNRYGDYLQPAGIHPNYFILDAEKLWTERYTQLSFSMFKYHMTQEGLLGDQYHIDIVNKLTIQLHRSVEDTATTLQDFFRCAQDTLNKIQQQGTLDTNQVKTLLRDRESYYTSFKMLFVTQCRYCRIAYNTDGDENSLTFNQVYTGAEQALYTRTFAEQVNMTTMIQYCHAASRLISLAELLSSLDLATYERLGGESPSIYVHIKNPSYFRDRVRRGDYTNKILDDIYNKFDYSKRLFTYFFTKDFTNEQRWDFIEDYFLGKPENELIQ